MGSVDELVEKLKEAGADLMGCSSTCRSYRRRTELMDATAKAVTAAAGAMGDITVLCCGRIRRRGGRGRVEDRRRVKGSCGRRPLARPPDGRNHRGADRVAGGRLRATSLHRPPPTPRTFCHASRRCWTCHGDLGHLGRGRWRHLRASDLCRQRDPDRQILGCDQGRDSVRTSTFDAAGEGGSAPQSKPSLPQPIPGSARNGSKTRLPKATVPN